MTIAAVVNVTPENSVNARQIHRSAIDKVCNFVTINITANTVVKPKLMEDDLTILIRVLVYSI